MIFDGATRKTILTGRKRQHRIPVSRATRRMKTGNVIPISKREKVMDHGREVERIPVVCWMELIDVETERVDDITFEGARAEGYKGREDFLQAWREAHPRTHECLCLTWRIADDVRILALTGRGDYTRSVGSGLPAQAAMPDWGNERGEPEGIDDLTQRRYSKESRDRGRLVHEEMLTAMREVRDALDARVKANPESAKSIGKYLWQIRGRIDAAEKSLKRRIAA